jgi:ACS family glucarate transporter-like MFS transporter
MGKPTSVRWRILALLTLAGFVMYLLKTNMSIAGKGLMTGLGFSQIQLGMILAALNWGYAFFQFPGGLYGDRIGARRALALMALAWGALTVLIGLVPGRSVVPAGVALVGLVGLQFLLGAAQAPFYPVTSGGTTANWFPVAGWAFPNGLQNAGLTLGTAATGPLVAWIMERMGWRQAFLLTAPLAFGLAAWWWWYARDSPAEHRGVNADEVALIDAGRPPAPAHLSAAAERALWKRVLRDRNVLLLTASYFCDNYVFYVFANWLFLYLVDGRGFTVLEAGFYSSIPWIVGAATAVAGGLLCDRLSKRIGLRNGCRWTAAGAMAAAGVFVGAGAAVRGSVAAMALVSLALASQQFADAAYWAATISISGKHASAACGVLNTGGNAVGGVVALVVPFLVRSLGWSLALSSGAVFALASALLWVWIRVDEPLRESS